MVIGLAVEVRGDLLGYRTTDKGELFDPEWYFSLVFFYSKLYGIRSFLMPSRLTVVLKV